MSLENIKDLLRKTPLINLFIWTKSCFVLPKAQNDEVQIINTLISRFNVPKSFIEFGFGGWEFNCADLIDKWEGLLVDGDEYNIQIAKIICSKKIITKQAWLTLDNLDFIIEYGKSRELGILSVDVDGNDYWFLEKLIHLNPAIIIVEYNSSFGLRPLTVPYDQYFERFEKHASGLYFGASLQALSLLANKNGYALIEVSNSGVNAFFVRKDLLSADDIELKLEACFREKHFVNGSSQTEQWEVIKNMEFINVP